MGNQDKNQEGIQIMTRKITNNIVQKKQQHYVELFFTVKHFPTHLVVKKSSPSEFLEKQLFKPFTLINVKKSKRKKMLNELVN